jgi:hypothetical protein
MALGGFNSEAALAQVPRHRQTPDRSRVWGSGGERDKHHTRPPHEDLAIDPSRRGAGFWLITAVPARPTRRRHHPRLQQRVRLASEVAMSQDARRVDPTVVPGARPAASPGFIA